MTRYFTIKEAEALIPKLEESFEVIFTIQKQAEAKIKKIQALESQQPKYLPDLMIEKSHLEFLAGSLQETILCIEKMGCLFKGVSPALVDFPFQLEGEDVLLCWERGEKKLQYYHGFEEGYLGRKPLPHHLIEH